MQAFLKDLFKDQQYDPENFFLLAGPCVVESEDLVMTVADKVSGICKNLGIPYVFKSSYRKANRTSAGSFTGIGDTAALELLKKYGTPAICRLLVTFMRMRKQLLRRNTSTCCRYLPS